MLVTARLKYVAESMWGSRRYLDLTLLDERPHRRRAYQAVGKCARILTVPKRSYTTIRYAINSGR